MFKNSQFNGDISQWNVSNVEEASSMFEDSQFGGDVSHWNLCKIIGPKFKEVFKGSNCQHSMGTIELPNDDFYFEI
jgi:hypothetical protein